MLATAATQMPTGAGWTFEPKYDGMRVLAIVTGRDVRLESRNGLDKSAQFPEIVEALRALIGARRSPVVLDGEIVARIDGGAGRFEDLQYRIHQRDEVQIAVAAEHAPVGLIALDVLAAGTRSLVSRPWTERRAVLESLMERAADTIVAIGETQPDDGASLLQRARREGWEGIMAKRMDAAYAMGARSRHWLKIKLEGRQELVVGGWTEPRNARAHIGALLLGYFEDGRLQYAGHTGSGFSRASLEDMYTRLAPLERPRSPFADTPRTNAPAHWTRPTVVVEVKFNQWTDKGRLRQPIFLGVRDDKAAKDVRREEPSMRSKNAEAPMARKTSRARASRAHPTVPRTGRVGKRLAAVEAGGGDGMLQVATGATLGVSNLSKVFFPESHFTKGDVMAYYIATAAVMTPLLADRPLVLQRYPNGVGGAMFFQQNVAQQPPDGVETSTVETRDDGDARTDDSGERFIGGHLATTLYCVQLGAIEVHPWHSRLETIDEADYAIIDLDPGPAATFARVVQVARWVREVMDEAGLHGALKTSGATGLHVYLPLPPGTSYQTSQLVAQLVATRVSRAHAAEATVVRSVKARPPASVYVDYLQNVRGKSVAAPFSVRAREPGRVSTPLDWSELTRTLDPARFTMASVLTELSERRRLWLSAMRRRNRLEKLVRRA
jgi:bifunctional non-homologous end joining protein LigD